MIDSDLLHGWWNDRFEEAQDCISCSYTALSSLFELYTRGGCLNHEVKSSGLKVCLKSTRLYGLVSETSRREAKFVNLGMGGGGGGGGRLVGHVVTILTHGPAIILGIMMHTPPA